MAGDYNSVQVVYLHNHEAAPEEVEHASRVHKKNAC